MQFNPKKSVCAIFSKDKRLAKPPITLSGNRLKWTDHIKHLGNYVSNNLKESEEINKKKCNLIGKTNLIIGNLCGVSAMSLVNVFRSQCSMYGAQAWCLSDSSVRTFHSTFNRCIRRILELPYATHTRFLPELSGIPNSKDSEVNLLLSFTTPCLKVKMSMLDTLL